VNPANGNIEKSQLTMARLPSGMSNAFRAGEITSAADGSVLIVGTSAAFYANRDATSVNGEPVGEYHGDPVFLWLRPDFKNRNAWVSLIRDAPNAQGQKNYGGSLVGIDALGQKAVVIGEIGGGGEGVITDNAIYSENQVAAGVSLSAVYLAIIPLQR
jgi:hypothetical protein